MARIRFLQTSDVHLRSDRPERRKALELIFELAASRSVDAVLIAGDLFDRACDAPQERTFVRQLIESVAPRPVVLVPGNHDADSFGPGTDYGANAHVLATPPYDSVTIGGLAVIGVPYQHGRTAAECLTGHASDPRFTVLVGHGTLALSGAAAFAGDGEDGAYMPFFPGDLQRRCCYAALGHLHSGGNLILREEGRLFAYAGSPVATSRRELGPRGVLVVDVEPAVGVLSHEVAPLATAYYERAEVTCTPGQEANAIEQLAREALLHRKPGARVLARLSGIATLPESVLREVAGKALKRAFGAAHGAGSEISEADGTQANEAGGAPSLVSLPILELSVTSYDSLAQVPVVADFVSRLTACAQTEGCADPRLLETALRHGLNAFLEVLS
jgi:DNA repair exonuclease SbcCD nuclease subunit